MRVVTETPEERLRTVRHDIPQTSSELADDLLAKSRQSVVLTRPLPVRIDQVLWSPSLEGDFKFKGDPTFAAYFSRGGFNRTRTTALIYLGTMNWTDQSKSMGQYLYLEKEKNNWVIKAHSKVWAK